MMIDVAIAGAGIGGLTAALSLAKAGLSVRVFESVREIRPCPEPGTVAAVLRSALGLPARQTRCDIRSRRVTQMPILGHCQRFPGLLSPLALKRRRDCPQCQQRPAEPV